MVGENIHATRTIARAGKRVERESDFFELFVESCRMEPIDLGRQA